MPGSVIVGSARTPIGKLSGALAGFSATDLGGLAIKAALERAGVDAEQVDYVLMGQVLLGGQGQITARQAAVKAGIPMTVPATTVNKVCLSGINAIYLADQMIAAGDAEVVVAGGMESMTNAPYLLPGARAGYRMGNNEVIDSLINDGLWCAFDAVHMGAGTENYVGQVGGITREAQDELAAKSHERAAAAQKEGRFADEITPISIPQRKGDPVIVDTDEGVRPGTSTESLGGLRPAFSKDGTITAGNASQISDGAAAVIVMSKAKAEELGATPLAELIGYGMVAGPDPSLLTQPSRAIKRALEAQRHDRLRRRPVRAQRGVRRGRHRVDARPRHLRRHRQRQRRRHRARSPDRHVGHARGHDVDQRAAPARWRRRCRGTVRRRRPRRRRDHPHAVTARRSRAEVAR